MAGKARTDLTQEEILAWADGLTGIGRAKTAERLGVSEKTVQRWREKVGKFISQKFDLNEYRMPLYGLYPLWLNSVLHNLKKNDVTLTVALGKGLQLLQEKGAVDVQLGAMTDADLASLITNAVSVATANKDADSEGGSGASEAEDSGEEPLL